MTKTKEIHLLVKNKEFQLEHQKNQNYHLCIGDRRAARVASRPAREFRKYPTRRTPHESLSGEISVGVVLPLTGRLASSFGRPMKGSVKGSVKAVWSWFLLPILHQCSLPIWKGIKRTTDTVTAYQMALGGLPFSIKKKMIP